MRNSMRRAHISKYSIGRVIPVKQTRQFVLIVLALNSYFVFLPSANKNKKNKSQRKPNKKEEKEESVVKVVTPQPGKATA